jgi:hypothetical protein
VGPFFVTVKRSYEDGFIGGEWYVVVEVMWHDDDTTQFVSYERTYVGNDERVVRPQQRNDVVDVVVAGFDLLLV